MNTRCDALFKKETVYVDVHRMELAYTSRSSPTFCVSNYILYLLLPSKISKHTFMIPRESLKSLQAAGGAYSLVTTGKYHEVLGGSLRNFSEGDNIRVIRPKDERKAEGSSEAAGSVS